MSRLLLSVLLLLVLFLSCSKDETGALFTDFPLTYEFDTLATLGTTTYYYTDSIIYKVRNDLVAHIDNRGERYVDSLLLGGSGSTDNFLIDRISFNDVTRATVTRGSGPNESSYIEQSGIGLIQGNPEISFKVNPDLDQLITCFAVTSKRQIDTVYDGSFLPQLDTLYNDDSTFFYQLMITEGDIVDISYCNPFGELNLVTEYARSNNFQNNDRIITHRTDILFKRTE